MASPAEKRFDKTYGPIADAIARLDIDQEVREQVADAITEALSAAKAATPKLHGDFNPEVFRLIASDPLCACVGTDDGPCPHGREIRVAMHLSSAPDGRSFFWRRRKPEMRCVSCGAKQFVGVG